ncbi:hypothetical protein [Paraburkholderia rhizosphaerae]|jgi:hypothetical protein|uniref:Uncharacterized protein n=1 Tax=Paraburkholderia rhizosphaerae TaxID=480658 RepID=A0A4R8LPK7_9BURK|nr:hypothetical protein [Paraburkholderia rhizosphaerae]TDY46542.1 hypothetical protein BX592_113171 [Paraburkholderia rhizosphaerae]
MSKPESSAAVVGALLAPARPIVYRKPAAPALPQPYTLPPRIAARRHAQILNWCVVGGRRKAG